LKAEKTRSVQETTFVRTAALVRDAAGRSTISYEAIACAVVDELEAARTDPK
jgi:putative NADH-flavin reductase